jgi:hypothetical protein
LRLRAPGIESGAAGARKMLEPEAVRNAGMEEESTAGVGLDDAMIDEVVQSCSGPSALHLSAAKLPDNEAVEDGCSWLRDPFDGASDPERSLEVLGREGSRIGAQAPVRAGEPDAGVMQLAIQDVGRGVQLTDREIQAPGKTRCCGRVRRLHEHRTQASGVVCPIGVEFRTGCDEEVAELDVESVGDASEAFKTD